MAGQMEFWGVEVKGNKPCQVPLKLGYVIHVSQATLGDIKKDKETVIVQVKTSDKKLVMGMLNQDTPQLSFDLVFDEDFEISHNWKNGSIHLMGYLAATGEQVFESDSSDEEEEDVPIAKENGQIAAPIAKPSATKPKEEIKPKTEEKDDSTDDSDSDEGDEDSDNDGESDEATDMSDSEDDSEDGGEKDSEEEKPTNANAGKKRPNPDAKTPQSKKAKLITPQKTDAKKGVAHVATPYPTNKSGKTPAGDKTPKSSGVDVACDSCKKTFKSDSALQSHSKAKHGAK